MKPIVHIPHPALTAESKAITKFDSTLTQLVKEMKQALKSARNPKGVGLAAPQIGEKLRIFIAKPTEKSDIFVCVNPIITNLSADLVDPKDDGKLEGCLSIPKIWGAVKRSKSVTLSYQDITGENHTSTFTEFLATIVQHETDHLNGILFTRRVVEQNGKLFQTEHDEKGKEILEEIKI